MELCGYIIPKHLENASSILDAQRLIELGCDDNALCLIEDTIGVELQFFDWDFEATDHKYKFNKLIEKLKRDTFLKTKNRNATVRAANSFVSGQISYKWLNKAIPPRGYYGRRRY